MPHRCFQCRNVVFASVEYSGIRTCPRCDTRQFYERIENIKRVNEGRLQLLEFEMTKCTFSSPEGDTCPASAITMTPPLCYAHMRDEVNALDRKYLEHMHAISVISMARSRLYAEANIQKPVEIGSAQCLCGRKFPNYLDLWSHVSDEDDSSYHAMKSAELRPSNNTPRPRSAIAPVKKTFDPNNIY